MNELSKETLEQAKSFDMIGDAYDNVFGSNPYQENAVTWLNDRIQPGSIILDVGCGNGLGAAKQLVEHGNKVIGVDYSKVMLELAKKNVPAADFHLMDMRTMLFEEQKFDAITAFCSLLHLPKGELFSVIRNLVDHLYLRGLLVFSLVEGQFDNKEVIFLGQKVRISTYLVEEIRKMMAELPVVELNVKRHTFKPKPGAFRESQMYFYYQKVKM